MGLYKIISPLIQLFKNSQRQLFGNTYTYLNWDNSHFKNPFECQFKRIHVISTTQENISSFLIFHF